MDDEEIEGVLADMPPSAKLVYKVLEYHGRLSQQRLVEETRLSPRTLRYAINQLEEAELVDSRPAVHDARQTCYTIVAGSGEGYAHDAVIDPDWLHDRLSSFRDEDPSTRLVRVATDDSPDASIPGSAVLTLESNLLDPSRQRIPDRTQLGELLGSRGMTEETNLVLYDDGAGYYAAYVYWLLTYYGHSQQRLLDGGLSRWLDRGFPTTDASESFPRVQYTARGEFDHVRAYRDDAVRALTKDTVLLDVREASAFRGEADDENDLSASANTKGHIPGATNIPLDRLLDDDGGFASRSDLEDIFADTGVTGDREIIVYCGVGAQSALGWFVLSELLGYPNVKNYDGSWSEWGNLVDAPVETE